MKSDVDMLQHSIAQRWTTPMSSGAWRKWMRAMVKRKRSVEDKTASTVPVYEETTRRS